VIAVQTFNPFRARERRRGPEADGRRRDRHPVAATPRRPVPPLRADRGDTQRERGSQRRSAPHHGRGLAVRRRLPPRTPLAQAVEIQATRPRAQGTPDPVPRTRRGALPISGGRACGAGHEVRARGKASRTPGSLDRLSVLTWAWVQKVLTAMKCRNPGHKSWIRVYF
jgi:hypothetical protein